MNSSLQLKSTLLLRLELCIDKNNITCRMRGKATESLAHVLAGCPSLAQAKYLERHNMVLKVLIKFLHGSLK